MFYIHWTFNVIRQIYIYIHMIFSLLMISIHLFLQSCWTCLDVILFFSLGHILYEISEYYNFQHICLQKKKWIEVKFLSVFIRMWEYIYIYIHMIFSLLIISIHLFLQSCWTCLDLIRFFYLGHILYEISECYNFQHICLKKNG